MAKSTFSLHVNGKRRSVQTDPDEPLLWVLRDGLGLTGAKFGCGVGICGSCSVLINGTARRSCVTPVVSLASNDTIVTVEGLARGSKLTRLQQAFVDHTGSACGFCTPGMVITATALLKRNPRPVAPRHRCGNERQLVPLRLLPQHHRVDRGRHRPAAAQTVMSADRRAFIASMGGAFMACGFRFVPTGGSSAQATLAELDDVAEVCQYVKSSHGYRDWLLVGSNSKVTALTGRAELGQGLTTVIVALVSQGMGIAPSEVRVVMGDTELCPDDGPTEGSSATEQVGWGFWKVATAASGALRSMGAARLGVPADSVEYTNGQIVSRLSPDKAVSFGALVKPAATAG